MANGLAALRGNRPGLVRALLGRGGGLPQGPQLGGVRGPASGPGGPQLGGVRPSGAPQGPQKPQVVTNQPGLNPYTGQPLGPNEYVGVAGSEAEHPGMTRIPPPGWWDPSNPNYERRNYYIAPDGKMIAREAGFDPGADDPWDTGREGEVNGEYEGMAGGQSISLSEPGVTRWHAGQPKPSLPGYQPAPAAQLANQSSIAAALAALRGPSNPRTTFDPALIAGLKGTPTVPQMPTDFGAPQAPPQQPRFPQQAPGKPRFPRSRKRSKPRVRYS